MIFVLISFKPYWWRKRTRARSLKVIHRFELEHWHVINNNSFISFFSPSNGNNYVFTFVIFESSIIVGRTHRHTHTHTLTHIRKTIENTILMWMNCIVIWPLDVQALVWHTNVFEHKNIYGNANSFSNYLFNDLCIIRRRRRKRRNCRLTSKEFLFMNTSNNRGG